MKTGRHDELTFPGSFSGTLKSLLTKGTVIRSLTIKKHRLTYLHISELSR